VKVTLKLQKLGVSHNRLRKNVEVVFSNYYIIITVSS
jgi:hypothetical protein